MFPSHCRIKLVSVAVASALSAIPLTSQASGFALIEQNASGLGNAYSGAAAAAEDASTIYFNPAGMSLLPKGSQFSIGLNYISPAAKFNNSGSQASGTGAPLPAGVSTNTPAGNFEGVSAGKSALVPNAYFAMELAPKWRAGIGVGVPFGLSTEYPSDWGGRFQAVKSSIETININPAVSYEVSDSVSLGLGVNYQTIDATLTQQANYSAAILAGGGTLAQARNAVAAGFGEGLLTLKGKDSAWGWNVGGMFKLAPATRLGVAYRSTIDYNVTGTVQFDNRPAGAVTTALPNGNIALNIKMPDNLSFALSHAINDRWQLLTDATWTGWSVLNKLLITRTDTALSGSTLTNIPYNWKDTWRFGVGANYTMNDSWLLKMGVAYDQTPTNNTDRGPRLPDGDRTWLSLGAKYAVSKEGKIDFGYSHLFVSNPSINTNVGGNNNNSTLGYGLINGNYSSSVDIVSVSYTHSF